MNGHTNRFRTARLFARVLLGLPLIAAGVGAQGTRFRDSPSQHYKYWFEQRAWPNSEIPSGALRNARKQINARWPQRMSLMGQAVGNGWTPVGPTNIPGLFIASSGRLTAIAVHPTTPATIYVGGAQGGVWKTVNGGANWTPVTDDMCSLAIGSIVIDQVNPDIVYAGTGELHNSQDSYYGCGVLRSLDGGTNWEHLGAAVFDIVVPGSPSANTGKGGAYISRLVIDRSTAGSPTATTLFAATNFGVYKSTNSGVDWVQLNNGIPIGIMSDMVADTLTPGTVYAAHGNTFGSANNGVYKTTDFGATWVRLTTFPSSNIGRINMAISQSSPNIVYAAIENVNTGQLLGIWKTVDGGANWTQPFVPSGSSLCASQCWYDQHIAVHPLVPDTVYYGGLFLHKSSNGAANFTSLGSVIHVDHHAFAFDPLNPSVIYSGNDGGIYKSTDGGAAWTTLNTDISIHQFYPGFSLHPTDPNRMMGGSQDNGTSEYNGSLAWLGLITCCDGGFTAIDHINGNTAWGEAQWIPNASYSGPRRRDGPTGTAFNLKRNGIVMSERAQFIPPFVMDPVNPRVLYFGTFRLYRTRDNGELWEPISPDLTGGGRINAIAIARADTNTVYVGTTDGRVQVTSDAGVNWLNGAGLPNPTRFVTDLAVDPTNAAIAYVTLSGFGTPHVYKTVDRGATWQSVSGNLPDLPVNAIVIQPGVEIDIGTDLGLFRTTNGGATWDPFPGIPNVAVVDLVFNPATQLLVAATHGRGAFKFTVQTVLSLRGDVTADYTVTALDAQAVLSATVGLILPPTWKPNAPNGDANCDGIAPTASDAQIILSYVVGLPVGGFCVGKFQ